LELGAWRLETGDWRLEPETRNPKPRVKDLWTLPIPNPQSPF
jgi:hypothetical protein